jgi:hypothetical protein
VLVQFLAPSRGVAEQFQEPVIATETPVLVSKTFKASPSLMIDGKSEFPEAGFEEQVLHPDFPIKISGRRFLSKFQGVTGFPLRFHIGI